MTVAFVPTERRGNVHGRLTADRFLRTPDCDGYELVDGFVLETGSGAHSAWVAASVGAVLGRFCDERALGWVLSAVHVRCFEDSERIRRPDIAFVRLGRFEGEAIPKGEVRIAPDLAVEVVSPNEEAMALEGKTQEYLSAGVRLIWVVYPQLRSVTIHRADGSLARVREGTPGAVLSGEDVLPGFAVTLAELFRPPVPQPAVPVPPAAAPPTSAPPTPPASPAAAAPAASSTSVTPPA